MIMSPISIPSFALARPHAGAAVAASWPMSLCSGHLFANQVDTTTGTTGSKRLDPGLLLGTLT
jgi:hypothetical protein